MNRTILFILGIIGLIILIVIGMNVQKKRKAGTQISPTPTPTSRPAATPTPAISPLGTPLSSPTPTPTISPLGTPLSSPTPTPTISPLGTPLSSPTPTPTISPLGTPVPGPSTIDVSYDNVFDPPDITIKVGDTVRFTNNDSLGMWVASDPHPIHTSFPPFESFTVSPGGTYQFTFNSVMIVNYHNHLNPSARGSIKVE